MNKSHSNEHWTSPRNFYKILEKSTSEAPIRRETSDFSLKNFEKISWRESEARMRMDLFYDTNYSRNASAI